MTFTTNSLGFRGPEPAEFPYRPILFLGDSYTMGYGVNDGEEFPALIGQKLARMASSTGKQSIHVVNAGVGSYGNGGWLKFLRLKGEKFSPILVVLQLTSNDFNDNVREGLFELDRSGKLVERPVEKPSLRTVQEWIERIPGITSSRLMALIRQVVTGYDAQVLEARKRNDDGSSTLEELTYRILDEVLEFCQVHAYPAVMLTVAIDGARLERLRQVAAIHRVALLRLPSKEERPDLFYKVDGHWNSTGHEFVAAVVFQEIMASGVLGIPDE